MSSDVLLCCILSFLYAMQCMPLRVTPINQIRNVQAAAGMGTASARMFWLDGFAKRQWDPSYKGTKLLGKIDQQVLSVICPG